jgi:hypothetical protein
VLWINKIDINNKMNKTILRHQLFTTYSTKSITATTTAMSKSNLIIRPLPLYRRILRLHRTILSPEKRKLGDLYIKKEFRDHKNITNQGQIQAFLQAWNSYANDLEQQQQQSVSKVGKDLDVQSLQAMSREQLAMLSKLEQEARSTGLRNRQQQQQQRNGNGKNLI